MTIKQQGGVFGRHPEFGTVDVNGLTTTKSLTIQSDTPLLKISDEFSGSVYSNEIYQSGIHCYYDQMGLGSHYFSIGRNKALTVRYDRNVVVDAGNLIIGTSGKGIDFSATAGTGTSELFDDYEEGTWTPVAADAETGGNTGTAGTANGYYTKVGNVVHVMGVLVNINTSGLTAGNLFYIQGLPFASKDLSGATAYYLSGGVLTSLVTITGNVQMYLGDLSKTAVGFYDAGGNILVSDLSSGVADFYFSLTYMAA